jgi:short-subunit dehydrogenase involved in D-alanine esterification of teichoic acids
MTFRTSLVTGGTGGIGRAVARRLAQSGDRVLVVGRDLQRGASVLAELRTVVAEVAERRAAEANR